MVPENSQELRPTAASRLKSLLSLGIVAALLIISYQQVNFNIESLFTGARDFWNFFLRLAPDWTAWPQIWPVLLDTLRIAYVATIIGTLIAMPLIFLASSNTTINAPIQWIARVILTILRSIPDLLWAALWVALLGLGALPGVVALVFFTIGVLAKLGSESVEAVDPGPLEALKAVGAGRNRMIIFAVIPQVAATMTSFILYSFEINVRASVVIGFVGAGGIGLLIQRYLAFFDYTGLGALIIIIFAVVLLIDGISVWARSKLI